MTFDQVPAGEAVRARDEQEERIMAITVEAVYENGVLRPAEPLPWKDGERVRVAVSSLDSPILKAYGIMAFKGTAAEAEYFALDPDLLPEEGR
jgi:predicted DNA-binding antitoxin AbrB/MazE fold protein